MYQLDHCIKRPEGGNPIELEGKVEMHEKEVSTGLLDHSSSKAAQTFFLLCCRRPAGDFGRRRREPRGRPGCGGHQG